MAQSARHSRWEVGLDLCFSIVINLGIQAFFLETFSLKRGLSFTAVFLTLAMIRRYLVRRAFNRLVRPGEGQSRRMSLVESMTDTALAVAMAFGMGAIWYPTEPMPRISGLIATSYALTMVRRFALRRFFEWLAVRRKVEAPQKI